MKRMTRLDYRIEGEFGPPLPIDKKRGKHKKEVDEDGNPIKPITNITIEHENPEKASARDLWIPVQECMGKPGPEKYQPNWKFTSQREWYPKISFTKAKKKLPPNLMFISNEHQKLDSTGMDSPGPKYRISFQSQFSSWKNDPSYTIAAQTDESGLDRKIKQSPLLQKWHRSAVRAPGLGPGMYPLQKSFKSLNGGAPRPIMNRAQRFKSSWTARAPGPKYSPQNYSIAAATFQPRSARVLQQARRAALQRSLKTGIGAPVNLRDEWLRATMTKSTGASGMPIEKKSLNYPCGPGPGEYKLPSCIDTSSHFYFDRNLTHITFNKPKKKKKEGEDSDEGDSANNSLDADQQDNSRDAKSPTKGVPNSSSRTNSAAAAVPQAQPA
mmetsp:Transcript_40704/g.79853  ORF Transcript_40704/g.79853 Transcript_40704/m.79853 type:complete len:383 (+) Transcript_40704:307-1455(+)